MKPINLAAAAATTAAVLALAPLPAIAANPTALASLNPASVQ